MERTLLVLGASYSQIPLFKTAKRLGIRTAAATIPGPYAGIPYADEVLYCDITKPEEVLDAISGMEINAVTTCCMDVGTRTMGYICEKRGLPGPGIGAAAACDKYLQKELYRKSGVRTAQFRKVSDEQEMISACEEIGFPVMLKAVDLMGSRGVFRADSAGQALALFPDVMRETKKDYCIVEKFLAGTMFGIEAMMNNGRLAYALPLGNDLHQGNPPFPQGHHIPWEEADRMNGSVTKFAEQVCMALEFNDCAVDMDCMLSDGKLWIIEATPRAGATAITDLVGIYYGIDYFEAIIRCALGEDVSGMFAADQTTPCASWLIGADKDGVIDKIVVPETIPDYVVDLSFNVKKGDRIRKFSSGRDRIGQLIVKGVSSKECGMRIREILSGVKINERQDQEM